jgi:hypothetical protein
MLVEAVLRKNPISLVTKYFALKMFKSAQYPAIKTYLNLTTKWWVVCIWRMNAQPVHRCEISRPQIKILFCNLKPT